LNAAHEKAAGMLDTSEAAQEIARSEFTTKNDLDYPTGQRPDQKRLATITAQMAMAGHTVHKIESGFLVCRWGMTKVCPDLAALVGFSRQIGVRQ